MRKNRLKWQNSRVDTYVFTIPFYITHKVTYPYTVLSRDSYAIHKTVYPTLFEAKCSALFEHDCTHALIIMGEVSDDSLIETYNHYWQKIPDYMK